MNFVCAPPYHPLGGGVQPGSGVREWGAFCPPLPWSCTGYPFSGIWSGNPERPLDQDGPGLNVLSDESWEDWTPLGGLEWLLDPNMVVFLFTLTMLGATAAVRRAAHQTSTIEFRAAGGSFATLLRAPLLCGATVPTAFLALLAYWAAPGCFTDNNLDMVPRGGDPAQDGGVCCTSETDLNDVFFNLAVLMFLMRPSLLWVSVPFLLPGASAMRCAVCLQDDHDTDHCPITSTIAGNVAAIAAGTYAAVKTVEILPTFLYRLFPEAAVQAIVAMVRRARSTRTTFDFTGKGEGDIYSAIESGVCTPEEAKVHINANYLNKAGDQHAALRAEGRAMMKEVREIEKVIREKGSAAGPSTSLHTHGHFRYCLARVQLHVMGSLRANMYVDTGGATTDTSAATSYKSTYQHPKSASDFFEMISLWE